VPARAPKKPSLAEPLRSFESFRVERRELSGHAIDVAHKSTFATCLARCHSDISSQSREFAHLRDTVSASSVAVDGRFSLCVQHLTLVDGSPHTVQRPAARWRQYHDLHQAR
jgi:hypothetical protein